MAGVLTFDEIEVGMELEPYEYRLTRGRLRKYIDATEDDSPWYEQDSPFGGAIAPPTICDRDVANLPGYKELIAGLSAEKPGVARAGFLHAKHEFEFINPARAGMTLRVAGSVVDKYKKRGREYVTVEAVSTEKEGCLIAKSRQTVCWLSAEEEGGPTRVRTEPKGEATREEVRTDSGTISLSRMVTLETSQEYSGWPEERNFHTDLRIAKEMGFPSVLVQGLLGAAYLSQMCANYFGKTWFQGGRLSVNFIKPIFSPQRLTAKGAARDKLVEKNDARVELDVWLEDEQRIKVQVGMASVCQVV